MPPPDLPDPATTLGRLRVLADAPVNARLLCVGARRAHGLKSVDVDRPQLGIVLHGTKQLRCGGQVLDYVAGDLLAMAAGVRIDAVNRPDEAHGRYLTLALPICDEVLTAVRVLWPHPVTPSTQHLARVPQDALTTALVDLAEAIAADDETRGRTCVLALLMHAARQGCTNLLLPPAASVARQIRALVAASPARAWPSSDVELALGLSGATLRRRLADEDTTLRAVITDARLGCAVHLLYTTALPVKTVAARVGYRSVDAFSRRFRLRYGSDPSAIGNAPVELAALVA